MHNNNSVQLLGAYVGINVAAICRQHKCCSVFNWNSTAFLNIISNDGHNLQQMTWNEIKQNRYDYYTFPFL